MTCTDRFRDQQQRAEVCCVLLARVGLTDRWDRGGPTPQASAAGRQVSRDAKTLLGVCWVIWESTTTPGLGEVLSLSPEHLRLVASLMEAASHGPRAIDRWIQERCGE
jgi:hypothetical protein